MAAAVMSAGMVTSLKIGQSAAKFLKKSVSLNIKGYLFIGGTYNGL